MDRGNRRLMKHTKQQVTVEILGRDDGNPPPTFPSFSPPFWLELPGENEGNKCLSIPLKRPSALASISGRIEGDAHPQLPLVLPTDRSKLKEEQKEGNNRPTVPLARPSALANVLGKNKGSYHPPFPLNSPAVRPKLRGGMVENIRPFVLSTLPFASVCASARYGDSERYTEHHPSFGSRESKRKNDDNRRGKPNQVHGRGPQPGAPK